MTEEALVDTRGVDDSQEESKRERSTIEFPYGDLNSAVEVARGVHAVGGAGCETDQLAAHLNLKARSGGFRQKMLTAKVFGLVAYSQGKVRLTDLGSKVCDPKQEKPAKATAFLTVPLYKAVYEKFKGRTLPPASGLEGAIVELGVARKQKGKARQYLQRSAGQADFFWSGQDRLVMPKLAEEGAPPRGEEHGRDEMGNGSGDSGSGDGNGGDQHPFIEGLIKTLPTPEGPWPIEKRAQWLQAAVSVFNLIYTDDSGGGTIEVNVEREPAQ